MRIVKGHDERKNEILAHAGKLFHLKGYEACTVNEILTSIGIAKGTFYHYFTSKEEVLDSIVSRNKEIIVSRAEEILAIATMSPEEKLMRSLMAMKITNPSDDKLLDDLHKTNNVQMHQKILNQIVIAMSPVLVKIIEEGIEKKVWKCKYPLQYMQIFLASSLTLTDEGIFALDDDSQMQVMAALIALLEKMVDAPEDSFMQLFMQARE